MKTEKIIIAGEAFEFTLPHSPLSAYLKEKGIDMREKDYAAVWELKDNGLHLVQLDGYIPLKHETINLDSLFPNASSVRADWFTGTIEVIILLEKYCEDSRLISSDYKWKEELIIDFSEGKITKIACNCCMCNEHGETVYQQKDYHEISFIEAVGYVTRNKVKKLHDEAEMKGKSKDFKGALACYDEAIRIDETNPIPCKYGYNQTALNNLTLSYVHKAGIYYKMGKEKLVLECLNKALSIDENCPQAYINRALYHRHHKDYEAAQKDYEKAKELAPASFEIVLFNEEDIFKYGTLSNEESDTFSDGELFFNIHLTRKKLKKVKHVAWKVISELYDKIDLYKEQGKPTKKLEKQLEALNKQEDEYEVYYLEMHDFDTSLTVAVNDMPYFFIYRLYPKAIYNQKLMWFQYRLAMQIFKFKTYVLRMKVRPLLISNVDDDDIYGKLKKPKWMMMNGRLVTTWK